MCNVAHIHNVSGSDFRDVPHFPAMILLISKYEPLYVNTATKLTPIHSVMAGIPWKVPLCTKLASPSVYGQVSAHL